MEGKRRTLVVDHDVAGLAGGVGADHAGAGDDLADEGVLLLGDVNLHLGLVPVAVMGDNDQYNSHDPCSELLGSPALSLLLIDAGTKACLSLCLHLSFLAVTGRVTNAGEIRSMRGAEILTAWPRGSQGRHHREGWVRRDRSRRRRRRAPWGWPPTCGWREHRRGHCGRKLLKCGNTIAGTAVNRTVHTE